MNSMSKQRHLLLIVGFLAMAAGANIDQLSTGRCFRAFDADAHSTG